MTYFIVLFFYFKYIFLRINLANGFSGCENFICVYKGLLAPLYSFSCTQVTREGYVYHKNQAYNVFDKVTRREYNRSELQPMCRFPTVAWETKSNSNLQKYHLECDVYVSNDLIDNNTSRIIQWSLDRLANASNDYFVPMYQNIIDPNLTVSNNNSILQWTASEFLVDEFSITRSEVIYALQLSIKKTIGKKFPKYMIVEILSYLTKKDDRFFWSVGRAKGVRVLGC